MELIQGEGGVYAFDKEEVQKLAKFLKEKDILLIIDEVQTGIYRTSEFLASNLYEIKPDIITMAKGLGGGVPIGAIFTTLDVLKAGEHGSTFGGNYLATKASLEVLNILEEYKDSGKLDENFIYFEERVNEIGKKYPRLFEEVTGLGLMRGLKCKGAEIQEIIYKEAHLNRVLVLKAGRNVIRFLPPLTITKEEIDEGFKRFEDSLKEMVD
jgi:acetylornithine/N-succinyldiaminopimelate aminotransferase